MSPSAMTAVSPEEARKEIGRILLAREKLAYFAEYMSMDADNEPWYQAHRMHHLIASELEAVLRFIETDGKEGTQFLMIFTPPQHGKSQLISKFFPAWAVGKLPNLRVIHVSYGADLASENSRHARDYVKSERYAAVFGSLSPSDNPVELSGDSKGATAWDLAAPHRGGMIAAGVGGAIPGRAKGLGLFDDPIKGHKEALSQPIRDEAWDFYISALRVRVKAMVLVMTRWHPDDPAGRIIRDMVTNPKGDKWRIVMLPGIIDEGMFATDLEEQRKKMLDGVFLPLRDPLGRSTGQVLCPEMLTKSEMMKIRAVQQDYYFQALYQQMPYSKEGQRYKRDWFRIVNKLPDDPKTKEPIRLLYALRYWDKANSASGDYSVGVLMAYGEDGNYYILDIARGQWTSYERDQMMVKTAFRDLELWERRCESQIQVWHQQDPGSAGKDSAEATNRKLHGFNAKFEPVTGEKTYRSGPLESAFQGQYVFLLKGAWNEAYIEESVAFDRGKNDDQVDAGSSAFTKLEQMVANGGEVGRTYSAPAVVVQAEDLFV